jgi:hypothetical protein
VIKETGLRIRGVRVKSVLIAVFFLNPYNLILTTAFAEPEQPKAMWVWDARVVSEPKSRSQVITFCRRHRVGTLYLSAYPLKDPFASHYRQFNRLAHRAHIQVHALAGDPRWGLHRYHPLPLQWVDSVRQFNAGAKPEERFDGIHTDVEVYLLSNAWNQEPGRLLGGYLDLNRKIAKALKEDGNSLAFGVDIPFWFDDDPDYRILWQGQVKPPSYHVLDTVDAVTVMAYRNFSDGSDGTVHLVSLELDYADSVGKTVVIGQETQEDLLPDYITFGKTSCAQMNRELKRIQQMVGGRPSFGGFAIHHYESYKKLCGE